MSNKFIEIRKVLDRLVKVTGLPREEVAVRLSEMDRMTARLIIYNTVVGGRGNMAWWWITGVRDRRIGGD